MALTRRALFLPWLPGLRITQLRVWVWVRRTLGPSKKCRGFKTQSLTLQFAIPILFTVSHTAALHHCASSISLLTAAYRPAIHSLLQAAQAFHCRRLHPSPCPPPSITRPNRIRTDPIQVGVPARRAPTGPSPSRKSIEPNSSRRPHRFICIRPTVARSDIPGLPSWTRFAYSRTIVLWVSHLHDTDVAAVIRKTSNLCPCACNHLLSLGLTACLFKSALISGS